MKYLLLVLLLSSCATRIVAKNCKATEDQTWFVCEKQ